MEKIVKILIIFLSFFIKFYLNELLISKASVSVYLKLITNNLITN